MPGKRNSEGRTHLIVTICFMLVLACAVLVNVLPVPSEQRKPAPMCALGKVLIYEYAE